MEPKELPQNIRTKVTEWLGHRHSIFYFWECEGTYMIVALSHGELYCLRVFPVGDSLELSQDNKMELDLR